MASKIAITFSTDQFPFSVLLIQGSFIVKVVQSNGSVVTFYEDIMTAEWLNRVN